MKSLKKFVSECEQQKEAAYLLGISQSTLILYMKGKRCPEKKETLLRFKKYGVDPGSLKGVIGQLRLENKELKFKVAQLENDLVMLKKK